MSVLAGRAVPVAYLIGVFRGQYERVIGRADVPLSELAERRRMCEDIRLEISDSGGMGHFRPHPTGPNLSLAASQRLFQLKNAPRKLHQSLVRSLGGPRELRVQEEHVDLLAGFMRKVRPEIEFLSQTFTA